MSRFLITFQTFKLLADVYGCSALAVIIEHANK